MPDFDTHLDINQIQQAGAKAIGEREEVVQESAENSIKFLCENALFINIRKNFDTLESRAPKKEMPRESKEASTPEEIEEVQEVQSIEEIATQYQRKNPELQSKSLLFLRARISADDSEEEILDKLQEAYPDPFLASDALDFLIETSTGELLDKFVEAKRKFLEMYGKEVLAGRNIQLQAREFSQTGLGTPSKLRELYKDVTTNPKDAATQFTELSKNYSFEKLKTVIAFVLHSLGSDLKSKGPSIDPGELSRLLDEARNMQAILGVYRFFKSRMRLILSSFEREDLLLPSRVTFEQLSKLFISFLLERFPTSDRLLQLGSQMGLSDTLLAELIIFAQMRDAIRQVSPKLFRGEQHRQDILSIFLEVLEQLEEDLDEEEDEEEEEQAHE